ncbi:EFM3 Protein-lysine N-methyltransferase EFM3 [Candida maltosa Xu316]|uniref:Uncharacterized protein n=1 Tax=Candida maltosa (strain Xu316) TaxID=1245528 RepID=M3JFV5_CANMX|nr:hypothetical protein G210_5975 [Candida maltosa Xu316]
MKRLFALIEQRVPARQITIQDEDLSYELQLQLAEFISAVIPLNPYYVKSILNEYIKRLESSEVEISDEIYDLYCDPQILNAKELDPSTPDIVKYFIAGFDQEFTGDEKENIVIKETPKLISGANTTGLRTWEAALYLSNFLNNKKDPPYNFKDRTILELGCGTGLVSLAIAKNQNVKQIIMTDGSTNVFDNMRETIKLNNLENANYIRCQQLVWGETTAIEGNVDYIVGADITFDGRIVEPLCSTINDLFVKNNLQSAIIAATIRNIDTINQWEQELNKWFDGRWEIKISIANPNSIESNCWFNLNTPEIRIYEINRQS